MLRSTEFKSTDFKFPHRHNSLSPTARLGFGLVCVAAGILPMLASFDIGPLGHDSINGPAWLGAAAGGAFIIAGIALLLGEDGSRSDHPLSYVLAACVLGALAASANWIAFGPGPRECTIAIDAFETAAPANSMLCRTGFAIGAGILDGFLIWLAAGVAQKFGAPGAIAAMLERFGLIVLGIALAPIALPLAVLVFGKALLGAFATFCATGKWPRNESFIARMKAKRDQRS
jgi:hypothetical protein